MSGESDSHETASSRVTRFRGHCLHPAETVTGDIYRHLLKGSFNWQVSDYVRGQRKKSAATNCPGSVHF